jgi:hypothetical protein
MSQVVRLLIGGNVLGGKQLESEASYIQSQVNEISKKQIQSAEFQDKWSMLLSGVIETGSAFNAVRYSNEILGRLVQGKGSILDLVDVAFNAIVFMDRMESLTGLASRLSESNKILLYSRNSRAFGRSGRMARFR